MHCRHKCADVLVCVGELPQKWKVRDGKQQTLDFSLVEIALYRWCVTLKDEDQKSPIIHFYFIINFITHKVKRRSRAASDDVPGHQHQWKTTKQKQQQKCEGENVRNTHTHTHTPIYIEKRCWETKIQHTPFWTEKLTDLLDCRLSGYANANCS